MVRAVVAVVLMACLLPATVSAWGAEAHRHVMARAIGGGRKHAFTAAKRVKEMGQSNDLIERLRHEPMLNGIDLDYLLDPAAYVGRAPEQVDDFVKDCVTSVREGYAARYAVLSSSEPKV